MERSLALDIDYLGVAEPGDGVAGTEYTQYPEIDTVTFNFSEPKEISFTAMGREDPWAVVSKKGDPSSIEYTIPSPTAEELKAHCGGTVTGDKWEAPVSTPTIIKTIKSHYRGPLRCVRERLDEQSCGGGLLRAARALAGRE